ncbi:MAG: DUF302 domain-containing protein [Actinomycetota bacterium]|nr:DUF302 domain-containing protein [Actinomycetota bacterium]
MRRALLALATAGLLALTGCGSDTDPAPAEPAPTDAPPATPPQVAGLAVYESRYDVVETSMRVQDGLRQAGMVVAVVDHAANASSVGQELRPTTLVIGGAPPAGTPIMQEQQRAAVDLPQKFLTWQAEDGTTYLAHNSAEYVAARAGIPADSPALDVLRTAAARISAAASGTDRPLSAGADVSVVTGDGYLVEQTSDASVPQSIARYQQAFTDRGLMAVATVDHAKGATSIGEQLRPTQVTFVGNPMVGTTLLQASQTIGIDLPVRYLAWEDEAGTVHLAHPDIRVLAERHSVTGTDETLDMIEMATARLTGTAAGAGG